MTVITTKRENDKLRGDSQDVVNRQEEAQMVSILSVVQDGPPKRSTDKEVTNELEDQRISGIVSKEVKTNIKKKSSVIETALASKNVKKRHERAPLVNNSPRALGTKSRPQLDGKKEKDVVLQSTTAVSNLELIIERSNHLCSRWDRVLGGRSSSATVLNEYLKKVNGFENGDDCHDYTNLHLAQMFDTLHPKTQGLPEKSPLMGLLKKVSSNDTFMKNASVEPTYFFLDYHNWFLSQFLRSG